jgi:hypothetical protein
VRRAFASARRAWTLDDCSSTAAVTTDLLNHEWALSNSLEACAAAGAALCLTGAGLTSCTLTGWADVCAAELHCLLAPIDSIHEVDFTLNDDVLALLWAEASALTTLALSTTTEKLLKFFENVSEAILAPSTASPELILEAFEAGETAKAATEAAEGVLAARLVLLIATHARHIVYPFLRFVS